jgi:hypothetical protein
LGKDNMNAYAFLPAARTKENILWNLKVGQVEVLICYRLYVTSNPKTCSNIDACPLPFRRRNQSDRNRPRMCVGLSSDPS